MAAIVVYGLMFIDIKFGIWVYFGLDYSSHTATALAMCIFLGTAYKNLIVRIGLAVSLIAYCSLMVFLNYHSWADILSTAVVVAISLMPIFMNIQNTNKIDRSANV